MLLHKLLWFRMGNEVSDALGVLRMRGTELDHAYLDQWAQQIGVADLLARARTAAGHQRRVKISTE